MCLCLSDNYKEINEQFVKTIKNRKFYKILCRDKKGQLLSTVMDAHYKKGVWQKSSRKSTDLTSEELMFNSVSIGCHVYVRKKEALRYLANGDGVLVEVAVKPEDFVAVEESTISIRTAVFMKVKITKILKEKKNGKLVRVN